MRSGIIAAIAAVAIALGLGALVSNWEPEFTASDTTTGSVQSGRAATPTPPPGDPAHSPAQPATPKAQ